MSTGPQEQIDEKDLAPLHRAAHILSKIGASISEVRHFINSPGTEFEGLAASISCSFGPMSFDITYDSHFLQTHFVSAITWILGDQFATSENQVDIEVEEFSTWLEENAPVPIEVHRFYGGSIASGGQSAAHDFLVHENSAGSVLIRLEIVMPWELLESSRIVGGVVVESGAETDQENQYFGLSLEQALPVLLDFMSRAHTSDLLPAGGTWSIF